MYSSQITHNSIIPVIYQDQRNVFRLIDIAMLVGESNFLSLNKKLNYYVRKGFLQNPRKGIYTKTGYHPEELACKIYAPSYISLNYVLQKDGIIFQYNSGITLVSYLSRTIKMENRTYVFRKIKNKILVDTTGIIQKPNHINIASAERAFLDMLYLEPNFYFDNLNPLNKKFVYKMLPLYQSKALTIRVKKLLDNG